MKEIQNSSNQLAWLDTIRFVSAFLVLLQHARTDYFIEFSALPHNEQNVLSISLYALSRFGREAVIVFFILSGFLVGGKALKKIISGNTVFSAQNYAIDRFVRIGIPLITTMLLSIIVFSAIRKPFSWIDVLGNLLSLQGVCCQPLLGPMWSLSYEVWLYILIWGIGVLSKRHNWGIVVISICFLVYTQLQVHYLFIWFIGAFAYLTIPKRHKGILVLSGIGVIISLLLSSISKDTNVIYLSIKLSQEHTDIVLGLSTALLIQQLIQFPVKSRFGKFVDEILSYCSKFSYTMYLSHRVILLVLIGMIFPSGKATMNINDIITFIFILFVTMLCSWIIYSISERYTLRVKTKVKELLH